VSSPSIVSQIAFIVHSSLPMCHMCGRDLPVMHGSYGTLKVLKNLEFYQVELKCLESYCGNKIGWSLGCDNLQP